ncbi:Carboxypeptidase A5 [Armadillidium nasatum]|uniref:Carboxypeptidase A5 n=1 Tax=Armadillidium nasatum TaxID=96803 RepID=A0A5N5SW59_9CRUS|nr:Carboxypeptidase A5 [Armadillidium nasatum]
MIPNIGKLIREQELLSQSSNSVGISFDQYNSLEDIEAYLNEVADSNNNATLRSIGKTVEGRDIWQLKFSVGSGKPAAWFDCNIHAREWLCFTWSNDRMWRKNRNKYDGELCYGIDLNRNFDDHFGGEGTSGESCAETYRGPSAASEPETQATQAAIIDLAENANLEVLYSLHSYSELWMYAFGWTDELPDEANELHRVTAIGVDALAAVHGIEYTYGPISTTNYPASSNTVDFGYYHGVTHSYTLELRDKGLHGFLLPENQIIPTAEETWAGLIAATLAV